MDWGYTRYFGLREAPFTNTPDSRFFFAHDSCQMAFNTLMVATRSGEGFIKITGEVGTGKTLLCRKFLSASSTKISSPPTSPILISNP